MSASLDRSCAAHARWRARLRLSCTTAVLGFAAVAPAFAAVPENLGNGLGLLVESRMATAGLTGTAAAEAGPFEGYTSVQAAAAARMAITDVQGRFMVRINPDGSAPIESLATNLHALIPSVEVTAIDTRYRKVGVMDAYVGIDDVSTLATAAGVRSVILELKPRHSDARAAGPKNVGAAAGPSAVNGDTFTRLGSVFDQGVTQHHVDQINQFYNASASVDYEGEGMSIGFISNSYAASSPAADVNRFDLPGAANNPVNTTPVVVLEDDATPGSDDEGRAMVEIGYKMAPKAKLAFATANLGEVDFAKNIRALAGIKGSTYPGQTFAADTICDDVSYFDEPYFQDGIIAGGVNDAAAFGVPYFSSAANDIGVNGYDSDLRWVANGSGLTAAAGNTALAGTNINLANVPPELYAGGFHNFNPDVGQLDIAQTVNVPAASGNPPATVLQWNEPYDQNTEPDLVTPPVFVGHGTITSSTTSVNFTIPESLTAGALYELDSDADPGSSMDSIVTITDPNGNVVVNHQDTEVDEQARFFAPVTGANYTVTINRFGTTTGPFTVTLYATNGFTGPSVQTRISLLAFTTGGVYVPGSSLTANNLATNEPIQLGVTARSGGAQLQYVFARANVPTGPGSATHIRYLIPGNGAGGLGPAEYFSYNTVTTGGHAMAEGSNGMAAYSVFRPSLPETFSSPGPVRIYFDADGNRLAIPQIRQQPRLAAADGANNTVLSPNFFGTSAAGPHAAAIGALVLEAHGGHHSLTPAQMTDLLEHSTFPHDLDPSAAAGVARTASGARIAIRIASDGSANSGTGAQDTNAFTVTYSGSGSLASLVFNPTGTAATAGNVSGGSADVTNVSGSNPAMVKFVETDAPGTVFAPSGRPFTIGSKSTITAANVAATYSNPAPAPSTSQSWTMTLTFVSGAFTQDKVLHYSVGRAEQHSANNTTANDYLADIFGGGVSLPSGEVNTNGMTFSGTTSTGETFSGMIQNRIGAGYSPVDGFGFINAEQAVSAPIP
jgi:hypothetical protein